RPSSARSPSLSSFWFCTVMSSPCTLLRGGSPATRCRSDPLRKCMLRSRASIKDIPRPPLPELRRGGEDRRGGHEALELPALGRGAIRVVGGGPALRDRVEQRLVHQLHAEIASRLELRRDLMRLVRHDQ